MIFYIAGPMSATPDYNRPAFYAAQRELEAEGHVVINPAWLPTTLPDVKYLPVCLAMVDASEAIYMLLGWENSWGAQTEYHFAVRQGKQLRYQEVADEINSKRE